ncbi:1-phosphofructokinase family hexose kinase [Tropicibacter naphthalenivorans]|uniref:Phosphofructokinase n=1 Tax=Tropicibacter naphthalenivorans TaxID=441103 RepID=A0A0P1GCL5_9RHOB|nr:1-phosphofructokinase family hexose kinase [Tropicibacter naphthalenivorans]CUH79099.1 6-phosphofructokinase isozyme 2 [Tropicibacter naphthalenivorans]SMD03481.1 6-phosphofructokinase [Tropicibacter naphthalenivorans]
MTQILTVTLNPALDLATSAARVVPGVKLRCAPETREPGGGGVNVARAITQLGGKATALVALGGPNGSVLEELLRARNLDVMRVEAPGETRHSFAVTDEQSGEQYRFVLSGPTWSAEQLDDMVDGMVRDVDEDAFVVMSGSMPPGADVDFLPRACAKLGARRIVIDTSGIHLDHQAKGPAPTPAVLRMDSHEAMTLSRQPLASRTDSVAFAEILRKRGAGEIVIIARGKDGSVMAGPSGHWHVNAANDGVVSAIGAGDSFVGGFTMSLAAGLSPQEALRRGAAAASAACVSEGTQLCLPEDFERLLPLTQLTQI